MKEHIKGNTVNAPVVARKKLEAAACVLIPMGVGGFQTWPYSFDTQGSAGF